ncbi:MAG TPA: cyclic nucleotide-binding domain-containing protein [Acidimicrobiia bacterium]|nr:cyclic nucleotide-binding domain-containing protein [Acidimicrobiia bacterium]
MGVDPSRIRDVPLFADLSGEERSAVATKLNERDAHEGQRLSTEGGAGYFFFVIESGTATVSHGDAVVATLGPGDFFGEAAILETTRRTATVTAATDMVLLEMFGADLAVLNAELPTVHAAIEAAMAQRLPG